MCLALHDFEFQGTFPKHWLSGAALCLAKNMCVIGGKQLCEMTKCQLAGRRGVELRFAVCIVVMSIAISLSCGFQ